MLAILVGNFELCFLRFGIWLSLGNNLAIVSLYKWEILFVIFCYSFHQHILFMSTNMQVGTVKICRYLIAMLLMEHLPGSSKWHHFVCIFCVNYQFKSFFFKF